MSNKDHQSSNHSNSARSEQPCWMESLPAEIRRFLLYHLDYPELHVLIHASPVFHDQYTQDRRSLLSNLLTISLGSVLPDACAVYISSQAQHEELSTRSDVTSFLESYQKQRTSQRHAVPPTLSEDQLAGGVKFHFTVVEPLLSLYFSWAKRYIVMEQGTSDDDQPLSSVERTRLLRAFYRFQLCCNLFGRGRHHVLRSHGLDLSSLDILHTFFCLFEPWEVEEIACIYLFVKDQYAKIFDTIKWDVSPDNPKFAGDRPPTPEGAFHLDDDYQCNNLLAGTTSRGLELLQHVIQASGDHEYLVSTMQNNMCLVQGHFLEDEALGEAAQQRRRERYPSDGDVKQSQGDPMPFRGDILRDEQGLCPPMAWTLMWDRHYSNLFGFYIPDPVRRLGYVMWDASRLERMDAKDAFLQLWDNEWETRNPNELIFG